MFTGGNEYISRFCPTSLQVFFSMLALVGKFHNWFHIPMLLLLVESDKTKLNDFMSIS